jgi:hypothetical protein
LAEFASGWRCLPPEKRTFAGGWRPGVTLITIRRPHLTTSKPLQRPRHIDVGDDVLSAVNIRAYRCDRRRIRRHQGRNPGVGLRDTGDHRQISSLRSTCFDAGIGRCRTIAVLKDDFRASQVASLVYGRFATVLTAMILGLSAFIAFVVTKPF